MKTTAFVSLVAVLCSGIAFAADSDPSAKQLQVSAGNLARKDLGSKLFVFIPESKAYAPAAAAAAWLDNDVSTGSPMKAGKHYYLLALGESDTITNFSISAQPASGTITLYASDEFAMPSEKSWTVVARNVPIESINEKKLAHSFNQHAKYLLIETNIADPGSVYGLYVYGGKPPEVAFGPDQGPEPSIDSKSIVDPKKNPPVVAIGPPSPYLPGALGFPPNVDRGLIPPLSP